MASSPSFSSSSSSSSSSSNGTSTEEPIQQNGSAGNAQHPPSSANSSSSSSSSSSPSTANTWAKASYQTASPTTQWLKTTTSLNRTGKRLLSGGGSTTDITATPSASPLSSSTSTPSSPSASGSVTSSPVPSLPTSSSASPSPQGGASSTTPRNSNKETEGASSASSPPSSTSFTASSSTSSFGVGIVTARRSRRKDSAGGSNASSSSSSSSSSNSASPSSSSSSSSSSSKKNRNSEKGLRKVTIKAIDSELSEYLGMYREVDACRKISAAIADVVAALTAVKECIHRSYMRRLQMLQKREGALAPLDNPTRNELQQALNIVTKRVEQLCSSVNLLSRTTQQSFGGLYFPKLNHSSQRIFEALPSLRSSAWQLLRVGPVSSSSFSSASSPSPPSSFELPPLSASSYLYSSSSAQSEFSSTVIFINDHLLHIRVIVRPFLQEKALMGLIQERSKKMDNEAKGGGSAGHLVIWEDVGEESNKAARLEETVFSLARELAYSLQDLAAVSQQIGEGGAEAAWRLSNDTQERLLKLLEAARKRALLMESTQQRLSLLEQVTNFRIQAWEVLHKAKKFIQPRRTKYDFLYHKTNSNSSKEEFEDEKEKKKLMRQSMLKKVIGSRQLNNEKNSFIVFLTPQEKEELEEIKRQALRLGEALLHLLNVFSRALHSNSSPTSSASAQQQKPTDSSPLKPSVILPLSPPSSSAITPSSSSNADVDIWQEPQGAEGTVIYQKRGITSVQKFGTKITSPNESRSSFFAKGIKAGTLNQLVIRLTHEYCHDLGFVKTFITTFQSFTTPQVLFEKLMQRFNVPLSTKGDVPEEQWIKHMVLPIQIRVVNVLGLWMKTRFADFDYDLIKRVNAFIDDITKDEKRKDWSEKWAKQLSRIIRRQIEQRRGETANRATQTKGSGGGISKILKGQEPDYLNNFDVKTLAQHFCVVEFAIFRAIQPVELLNQAWNKEKYHHRAPNVRSLIQLFNKVSRWISSSILREDKLKKRAKLMTKYLELAIQLFDYNNFNASLAIISGINNAAVHRLRFTRDEVASRLWDQIHDIQEVLGGKNYSCYRERLHSVNPPLLPYLGVYLTDLTFIEDGNPDFIGDLINFKKRELIYDVISEVQQYQQTEYSFTVDAGVVAFLKNLPMEEMEENDMYNLSLKREPRGIEKPSELP